MTQMRVGRIGLLAAGMVLVTGAVLVPALGHIHEDHLAPVPGDGSFGLAHAVVDDTGRLLAVGGVVHGQSASSAIFVRAAGGDWRSQGTPEAGAMLFAIAVDGGTTAVVGAGRSGGTTVWTSAGIGAWRVGYRLPQGLMSSSMAARAGTFAAVGDSSGTAPFTIRGNGASWTSSALPLPGGGTRGMVFSVIAGPDGFVAAGNADTPKGLRPVVWRSTDATRWTVEQLPTDTAIPGTSPTSPTSRTNGTATAVAAADRSTVVVGQYQGRPATWLGVGGTWTMNPLPGPVAGTMALAVVAVPHGGFAADGTITGIGDYQHGIAWTSADGLRWHATLVPQANTGLRDAVVVGDHVALIGGQMSGHKGTPLVVAAPPISP